MRGGISDAITLECEPFIALLGKGEEKRVEKSYVLPDSLTAPVKQGDVVGAVEYRVGDRLVGKADIRAAEDVERISYVHLFLRLVRAALGAGSFSE